MDLFSIVYGLGFLLCVVNVILIIRMMNKNLQDEYLWVDLEWRPAFLVILGGFCVFPFLNLIIGISVALYLWFNPVKWEV